MLPKARPFDFYFKFFKKIAMRSRLLGKYSFSFSINAIEIGIENVFVYYGLTAEIALVNSGSSSF